eukprot:9039446-Prorocentrum_lima.AAC.1
MTSSLVGSEMCIRDSRNSTLGSGPRRGNGQPTHREKVLRTSGGLPLPEGGVGILQPCKRCS